MVCVRKVKDRALAGFKGQKIEIFKIGKLASAVTEYLHTIFTSRYSVSFKMQAHAFYTAQFKNGNV